MVLMKIATRKLTLLRRLLHENHEYVVGVIVIADFLALDQELQEDEYEDTKEEEFVASIVSNCCGKVFKNRVLLAIHVKRTLGQCFCYVVEAKMSVECSDCVEMFKFKAGK